MDSQILTPAVGKNFTQTISFKGCESKYSVSIVAEDVKVNCSPGNHNHGSSKVKLTNVVDYNWEHKYYIGQLLAVHISGKYFAYGIKAKNISGKGGGMVRVASVDTRHRALIKDMNAQVQDLAFAHIDSPVILACVDEDGGLFVHKIELNLDGVMCTMMLHVLQPETPSTSHIHRVVWCPFLPEEDDCEDDNNSTLLVLTHGNKAELLNINIINNKHGVGPLCLKDITDGYLQINEHSQPIMDAAFSPDGTAVATASIDGYVKFFQIYMHEGKSPRCLHEWQPHEGKPLSYLDFLDNHSMYSSDEQFWKFAVTGCNNNTELKIWSCQTWSCLQTIRFTSSLDVDLYLKVKLDLTAGYLILSEVNTKLLYVLEMYKDQIGAKAYARSISEFLLPAPFLSFGIFEAAMRNFRTANSNEDLFPCEENDEFDEGQNIVATVIRMYVVQPKRLQECQIVYQTESCLNPNMDNDCQIIYEKKIDTEKNIELSQISLNDVPKQPFNDLSLIPQPINLMTPEAFNSPVKTEEVKIKKENPSPIKEIVPINNSSPNNFPSASPNSPKIVQNNYTSGNSSPSREVQEILNNSNSSFHEYYEEKVEENKKNTIYNEQPIPTEWPTAPVLNKEDIVLSSGETKVTNFDILQDLLMALMTTLRDQNTQLQTLQNEIKQLKTQTNDDIQTKIEKQITLTLAHSQAQHTKFFEHWANTRNAKDREFQENLVANISHMISKQVNEKLHGTVNLEMKQTVLPVIAKTFDNLKCVIQEELQQKLGSIDNVVKDSLNRLLCSKPVADSLSNTLAPVIRPNMEKCYKEVVSSFLIPSWEKACNNMFLQIHETFTQGTKEYTSSVETYMEKQRKQQEKNKEIVQQISIANETLIKCTERLSSTVVVDLQKQLLSSFLSLQDKLANTVKDTLKEQISIAFKNHASILEDSVVNAVKSRAVTPSPHVIDQHNILVQIQQLINQGQINQAFQQALSASDLSIVVYLCERLNPQTVFVNPCPLQQHVLLSLIQQLSADMSTYTELKHKYLEEAVLNLDAGNPVTREHMYKVLRELNRQLAAFSAAHPNHKILKNMKMLQMATTSLLKS